MQPRTIRWLLAGGLLGWAYLSVLITAVASLDFVFMRHPSAYETFLIYLGFSIAGAFFVLAILLAWKAVMRPAYIAVFGASLVFRVLLMTRVDTSGGAFLLLVPAPFSLDLLGIYLFGFNKHVKALFGVKT